MSQVKARNTVTLNIPSWMMAASKVVDYAKQAKEAGEEAKEKALKNPLRNLPTDKFKEKFSSFSSKFKKGPKIGIAVAVVLLLVVGVIFVSTRNGGATSVVSGIKDSGTDYSPDSTVAINKTIEIPIRNQDGSDTGDKLKISFSNVEKAKRVLIKSQGATARDGKAFLILNMEIENKTTNQLTVRPVDFIRLLESDERSFAPDVHNDDIEVEAISIKKTRVGYIVDDAQSSFKFAIGELSGNKDIIEVQL